MTPREIFLRALRRERTGRPAVGSATSVVTVDLMHKVGQFFPDVHHDAEKMAALAAGGITELGFDNVMPLFSVCHESAALGCDVEWGAIDRMPSIRGELFRVGDEIRLPTGWLSRPTCRTALSAISLLKNRFGRDYAIVGKVFGPWTMGYHVFGTEQFLINTLDQPDAVKRAMDRLKEVTIAFGRAQIEAGADALCVGDHATRDLCSPLAYRDFLQDVHAELVERLPCPLILHICGDTSDRIGMIAETGVACFHFDSKVPATTARELAGAKRGQSPFSQRPEKGDSPLSLMGGTSNLSIIRTGSEEAIRADVREKLAVGIDIIGPECAVPLDAPYRNLKLLAEAAKAGR